MIWRCDLNKPCVKFCESEKDKASCGMQYKGKDMTKEERKQKVLDLLMPIIDRANDIAEHGVNELEIDMNLAEERFHSSTDPHTEKLLKMMAETSISAILGHMLEKEEKDV